MRNIRISIGKTEGHILTSQRRLLLDLIRHADGHIDAKDLYRLASSQDRSISLATVYRALHLFKELGLVDEIRLGQAHGYYEIKRTMEHQHLLCRSCGQIIEFESPIVRQLVDKVQREYCFDVTRTELYLEGYCEQCKQKDHLDSQGK